MFVTVRRNAINFVIRRHDTGGVRFLNGGLERLEEIFANDAFRIVAGGNVGATFGLAVNGKMFGGCHHVSVVNERAVTLKAENGGYTDARREVRIFAIGFFGTAPTGIARQIQHGSETLLRAPRANFLGSGGEDIVNERGVPSAGECYGLRKGGAIGGHEAVETFFVEENWNAEACVLSHPFLNGVGEFCHFSGSALFTGTRHLTKAILEQGGGVIREEFAVLADEEKILILDETTVLPGAAELRDSFLESHAREKIGHALLNWQRGVSIREFFLARDRESVSGKHNGKKY